MSGPGGGPAPAIQGPPILTRSSIAPIQAQPTLRGQTIGLGPTLADGSVLLTYGDYNYNPDTGTDVLAVGPDGEVVTLLSSFDTEEITRYRVLNDGAVWAPSVDPRHSDAGSLATNAGGTWHVVPVSIPGLPVVEHMFDVAQEPDGSLYVCGSHTPDTAFVWRSTNGGTSWTQVLALASGQIDGVNRFYDFGRVSGNLAVTRGDGTWHVYNGSAWTLTPGAEPDPPEGPRAYITGTRTLASTTTIGGLLPPPAVRWSASLAPDGSVWTCDGDAIHLIHP